MIKSFSVSTKLKVKLRFRLMLKVPVSERFALKCLNNAHFAFKYKHYLRKLVYDALSNT